MSVCPMSCFLASKELFLVKIQGQEDGRLGLSNKFLAEILIGKSDWMLNCEENQILKCFSGTEEIKADKKFKRKSCISNVDINI